MGEILNDCFDNISEMPIEDIQELQAALNNEANRRLRIQFFPGQLANVVNDPRMDGAVSDDDIRAMFEEIMAAPPAFN